MRRNAPLGPRVIESQTERLLRAAVVPTFSPL